MIDRPAVPVLPLVLIGHPTAHKQHFSKSRKTDALFWSENVEIYK